eukprot:11873257-Alexandrium_andersonii.AAC.1
MVFSLYTNWPPSAVKVRWGLTHTSTMMRSHVGPPYPSCHCAHVALSRKPGTCRRGAASST